MAWKPKISYRYAFFQGDDPTTAVNEAFDPLLPGFYDWGTWWQGEIAGEYFLSNSNLISHAGCGSRVTPSESLSARAHRLRLQARPTVSASTRGDVQAIW